MVFLDSITSFPCLFQKPLPKLPVPDLKRTLEKYTELIQPILTPAQYAKTKDVVKEFGKPGGEGELLQIKLREYAETKDNWVSKNRKRELFVSVRFTLQFQSDLKFVNFRLQMLKVGG